MKMTVSYEWLCDLVEDLNKKSPEEIGLALTSIGAETEEVLLLNYGLACELAEISSINSINEKVSFLSVKTNSGTYQVVSNSQILEVGNHVIFAPISTKMFRDTIVASRNIENVQTEGLLLALENLGIEPKSSDITYLGKDKKQAQELFEVFTSIDAIYILEIPGNRADWLSVQGLARALSIHFNLNITEKTHHIPTQGQCDFPINIESNNCYRYSLSHITGITVSSTPAKIQKRLYLLGMRPINYFVDLSNATMLETGQPTHAFDEKKIKGSIIIRQAKEGEKMTLLDESEITLSKDDLLICDEEKILALAGIMGGLHSGVDESTTSIYLESASFNGVWIRRTAKRLGIKTESSLRFEKNITPELVLLAQNHIINNIHAQSSQAQISKINDVYPHKSTKHSFKVSPEEIRSYLGAPAITDQFMEQVIIKLGCTCNISSKEWIISPSGERGDLRIKEDIIEEIARFYGYDNIPSTNYRPSSVQLNPEKSFDEKIRPLLRGMGLSEAMTVVFRSIEQNKFYSLDQDTVVKILNPLNTEWTELRTHLFDGLLESIKTNISKAFEKNIALSEIASVFSKKGEEFQENKILAFAISDENSPYHKSLNILNNILQYSKITNCSAKRIVAEQYPFLHPLNAFEIIVNNEKIGFFGEIHPELLDRLDLSDKKEFPSPVICELCFETLKKYSEVSHTLTKINELPPIFRDITLSVPQDMLGINLIEELKMKNPLIKNIEFISVFQNEKLKEQNKKNISLRLRFESETVLNAQEIDLFIKELLV